jgi:hypothetical protein
MNQLSTPAAKLLFFVIPAQEGIQGRLLQEPL